MEPLDLHALQAASRAHAPDEPAQVPTSSWTSAEELETSRARRVRDQRVQACVADWYDDRHVHWTTRPAVDGARKVAGICTIDVRVGRGWGGTMPRDRFEPVEVLTPVDRGSRWRPRCSALMWDATQPYAELVARLVHALDSNQVSKTGCLHRPYTPGLTAAERHKYQLRAGQAIERGMLTLYHGHALASRGELPYIDTGLQTARVAASRARCAPSIGERLLSEQREIDRCMRVLRDMPHGFPDWGSSDVRIEIVTAYMTARIATPRRCSQVGQWPMRVAAALYVLAPHVMPVAKDGSMASLLADRGHKAFAAQNRDYYEKMLHNAAQGAKLASV